MKIIGIKLSSQEINANIAASRWNVYPNGGAFDVVYCTLAAEAPGGLTHLFLKVGHHR